MPPTTGSPPPRGRAVPEGYQFLRVPAEYHNCTFNAVAGVIGGGSFGPKEMRLALLLRETCGVLALLRHEQSPKATRHPRNLDLARQCLTKHEFVTYFDALLDMMPRIELLKHISYYACGDDGDLVALELSDGAGANEIQVVVVPKPDHIDALIPAAGRGSQDDPFYSEAQLDGLILGLLSRLRDALCALADLPRTTDAVMTWQRLLRAAQAQHVLDGNIERERCLFALQQVSVAFPDDNLLSAAGGCAAPPH